jgi:hypothetical protein
MKKSTPKVPTTPPTPLEMAGMVEHLRHQRSGEQVCGALAWRTRGGQFQMDVLDYYLVRFVHIRGGRRMGGAWVEAPGRERGEDYWAWRERLGAILERARTSLQREDPISDVFDHLRLTMGLKRSRGARSLALVRRAGVHSGYGQVGPERVGWLDHGEAWRRDRRVVVVVGHNYSPIANGHHHREPMPQDLDWRQLPEGMSWYSPGKATAVLAWHASVDAELRPFLDRLFGLAPPGTASGTVETTTSNAVLQDLLAELGGPADLNEVCAWCRGHGQEALLRRLLRLAGNRRQLFEDAVLEVIGRGEYPAARRIHLALQRKRAPTSLCALEASWRADLLRTLGWVDPRLRAGRRWRPALEAQP